jgi:hypothetical protein
MIALSWLRPWPLLHSRPLATMTAGCATSPPVEQVSESRAGTVVVVLKHTLRGVPKGVLSTATLSSYFYSSISMVHKYLFLLTNTVPKVSNRGARVSNRGRKVSNRGRKVSNRGPR